MYYETTRNREYRPLYLGNNMYCSHGPNARTLNRHSNIHSSHPNEGYRKWLGIQASENFHEKVAIQLATKYNEAWIRFRKKPNSHQYVPSYIYPYCTSFVAPDHLFFNLIGDMLIALLIMMPPAHRLTWER